MWKLLRILKLDSIRGQIFFSFIFSMIIILTFTMSLSYWRLTKLEVENHKKHFNEIAIQVSGRLNAILSEADTLSLQIALDQEVQSLLAKELDGQRATFDERIQIRQNLLDKNAYSETIKDVEVYSFQNSIYPVVNKTIIERVGKDFVDQANTGNGKLVWIGLDQEDPTSIVGIRQIRIEKKEYKNGGYIVVKLNPSFIESIRKNFTYIEGSILYIQDKENNNILTNAVSNKQLQNQNKKYLNFEDPIYGTEWMLSIFIPKKDLSEGINTLRTILIWVSMISTFLFLGISYYVSSIVTFPIKRLTKVIQSGRDGLLLENPDQYFNREINQLNTMYNSLVNQVHFLIEAVYEKEIIKSKSEIKALHSQINPHFLYNTLDSLYWLLIVRGEKELSKFVIDLSELFRYTIQGEGQDGFVSVKQEMEQVRRYVNLLHMRWQDRLKVDIDIDTDALMYIVPKLTVQPIVENAIIHGIEPMEKGGEVRIKVRKKENTIVITVHDNGVGIEPALLGNIQEYLRKGKSINSLSKGTGIGLTNIHKLIQLNYGKEFGLEVESVITKGTTVHLRIPAKEKTT